MNSNWQIIVVREQLADHFGVERKKRGDMETWDAINVLLPLKLAGVLVSRTPRHWKTFLSLCHDFNASPIHGDNHPFKALNIDIYSYKKSNHHQHMISTTPYFDLQAPCERKWSLLTLANRCMGIYIYIYIYRERERERGFCNVFL
jgi:hypothetical protein